MKITALKYGESVFCGECIFKDGKPDTLLPISFTIYLIQTQGKNILVDAGCDDGAGFVMSVFKRPVDILLEMSLIPDKITDIVITHSHDDHISALGHYKKATFHVQKDEYPSAKRFIPIGANVNLIEDSYSLSDEITIKKIGGHSRGSCIVLAGHYVLCGDECYYRESLTDGIMTGASCCEEKSREFLNEYSKSKYIPLLFHDPRILKGRAGYEVIYENNLQDN